MTIKRDVRDNYIVKFSNLLAASFQSLWILSSQFFVAASHGVSQQSAKKKKKKENNKFWLPFFLDWTPGPD